MAEDQFNPFGLVDEATLKTIRGDTNFEQFHAGQQGLSGVGRGGHAIGFALGKGIRALVNRTGIIKDKQAERAKAVTRAQERAATTISAELRPELCRYP